MITSVSKLSALSRFSLSSDNVVLSNNRIKTFTSGSNVVDASSNVVLDFNTSTKWNLSDTQNVNVLIPKNFSNGDEAYILINAGVSVDWSAFALNGNSDQSAGSNHFDGIWWKEGSAPRQHTVAEGGFQLIKLMIINNMVIASCDIDTTQAVFGMTTLMLSRPQVVNPIFLKMYLSNSGSTDNIGNLTPIVDTTTADGRARMKAYEISAGVGSWVSVPSTGLSVDFAGAPVKIDLSGIDGLPGYLFYRWETTSGSDQPYESLYFPSVSAVETSF